MAYNRVADLVVYLLRWYLAVPCWHYFDDFWGIEPEWSALSGFWAFEAVNKCLGLILKASKRKWPSVSSPLLGVRCFVSSHPPEARHTPGRIKKIIGIATSLLQTKKLSDDQAGRLAGQCNFLDTGAYGRCGRNVSRTFYAFRASTCNSWSLAVEFALKWLVEWLPVTPGRPWMFSERSSKSFVIYSDATWPATAP